MNKSVLFMDGENFRHEVEEVLKKEKVDKDDNDFALFDFNFLLENVLKDSEVSQKLYYLAKLDFYKETAKKSKELISLQRRLKTNLENNGFNVVIAGHVRGQKDGKGKLTFKEKGVDVRIAVDLVAGACDKQMETAIICSSDSDLQPAVKEAKKRGVKVIYLGFQSNPNIGLTHTTDGTILFRNSEIVEVCSKIRKKR